jgi:hypothetical protein
MKRVWVLDTETKGTGAQMVPLEQVLKNPVPKDKPSRRKRRAPPGEAAKFAQAPPRHGRETGRPGPKSEKPSSRRETRSAPLPPGHVRKKATGEIGRVRSVDAKAGTASVLWLRQGRTSTVPLTAISRR